jgi:hypothetical protein
MSTGESPDRLQAISDAGERRAQSERLVTEIAEALAAAGEYVARIESQPTQRVVDFNWAARQAGQRLGMRVHVEMKYSRAEPDGKTQARVSPTSPLA